MWRHGLRPPEGARDLAVPVAHVHLRLSVGHCHRAISAAHPGRAVPHHAVPDHVIVPVGFAFPEANPHFGVAHCHLTGHGHLIADRHFVVGRDPAGIIGHVFLHHQQPERGVPDIWRLQQQRPGR
jgi:hypothetical protein